MVSLITDFAIQLLVLVSVRTANRRRCGTALRRWALASTSPELGSADCPARWSLRGSDEGRRTGSLNLSLEPTSRNLITPTRGPGRANVYLNYLHSPSMRIMSESIACRSGSKAEFGSLLRALITIFL
jgi:hypothetical protein